MKAANSETSYSVGYIVGRAEGHVAGHTRGWREAEAALRKEWLARLRRARDRALWLGCVLGTSFGAVVTYTLLGCMGALS